MKREEKNLLSRQKILDSAIVEFGTKSYAEASVNTICINGEVSKGNMYHYFKDKDDLYLVCVKECFDKLICCFDSEKIAFNDFEKDIKKYMDMRQRFFSENPYFSNIFANAVLQPPQHLKEQIKQIKSELDALNVIYYEKALKNIELRSDVCIDEVIEYFLVFQDAFNNHFQSKNYSSFNELVYEHEIKLSKMLKIMLYGIAKEKTEL